MQWDEWGMRLQPNTCPCCGTGWESRYVHSEFCITSLATWTSDTVPDWRRGKQDGERGNLPRGEASDAYMLGYKFGSHAKQSERSVQSLDKTTDIARGKADAMSERLVPRYT